MTRDHSLLEDYKDAKPNMSEEEQRKFPHKNVITRALGMRETVQVDVLAHDIQDKDVFLLCSDGLSGMIEDAKIMELVKGAADLELAVSSLVEAANEAGGTDNITVLACSAQTDRRQLVRWQEGQVDKHVRHRWLRGTQAGDAVARRGASQAGVSRL